MPNFKYISFLLFCMIYSIQLMGQNPLKIKNWNNVGITVKALPNVNLSFNQTYGFNTQPYDLSFLQNTFSASFYIRKRVQSTIGHSHSLIYRKSGTVLKKRYYTALAFNNKLSNLYLSNSFLFEYHTKQETKYRCRLIYTFRLKPKTLKLNKKIKYYPYISTRLYYNIGGKPINQFTSTGIFLGKYSPHGLHRLRMTIGLRLKPYKGLSITAQLMRQAEFNTDFAFRHAINVYNPDREKIERPFSNYYMIGIGIKYYFKLKKVKQIEMRLRKRKKSKESLPNRYWHHTPNSLGQ